MYCTVWSWTAECHASIMNDKGHVPLSELGQFNWYCIIFRIRLWFWVTTYEVQYCIVVLCGRIKAKIVKVGAIWVMWDILSQISYLRKPITKVVLGVLWWPIFQGQKPLLQKVQFWATNCGLHSIVTVLQYAFTLWTNNIRSKSKLSCLAGDWLQIRE